MNDNLFPTSTSSIDKLIPQKNWWDCPSINQWRELLGLPKSRPCCGPNIDDWFAIEITNHWNWSVDEKSKGRRLLAFKDYAEDIPYKWMTFAGIVDGCPTSGCRRTVTLCDSCIDKSELGNIIYGLSGRGFGISWAELWSGAKLQGANGFDSSWDEAAGKLGYESADYIALAGWINGDRMCKLLKLSSQWTQIQDPNTTKGCNSCNKKMPSQIMHTK